ncbi:hypothetical protein CRYUN_Cryun31cG0033100 [Craigia yunnanensis]
MDSDLHIFLEMPNRGFGKITEAKELFEEMKMRDCSPSVVTYSSLIHGLCQSKNINEAIGLLEEMKSNGIEPNVFTYSSLMDGLCKYGRSSEAMELLETMGKLQEAVEILDRMKLKGQQPDAGLYEKIISGFCDINKFQEAANFLDEMVLGRTLPNRLTWSLHVRIYNMVVQGLCTKSDLSRAFQLYLTMRTRGISVETGTFETLMKSL